MATEGFAEVIVRLQSLLTELTQKTEPTDAQHVIVDSGAGAGTQYTEGDTDATITGTAVLWEDAADTLRAVSAAKPLPIGDAGGTLTVDQGTASNLKAQVTGAGTAGTADTGVQTVQGIASMTPVQVSQATAATLNAQVVGSIAHDTGVSGNPVVLAGVALDIDATAPPNRVSAESDTTRIATDRDGAVFVRPFGPQIWTFNATSAQTGAQVQAAPGSSLAVYITDIEFSINSTTASSIKLLMNGGADIWGPHYLEAIAGRGLAIKFQTPLKCTANGRVDVTSTGAATQSISLQGFIAQG